MTERNTDDGRGRGIATFLSKIGFNVDLNAEVKDEFEDDLSEYDEAYVQARKAGIGLYALLVELRRERRGWTDRGWFDDVNDVDDKIDSVERAVRSAAKIVKRAETNPELENDLSKLDPDLLREARGELVYIAHHLGIEVSLPAPET